jgi:hypothetical protein
MDQYCSRKSNLFPSRLPIRILNQPAMVSPSSSVDPSQSSRSRKRPQKMLGILDTRFAAWPHNFQFALRTEYRAQEQAMRCKGNGGSRSRDSIRYVYLNKVALREAGNRRRRSAFVKLNPLPLSKSSRLRSAKPINVLERERER